MEVQSFEFDEPRSDWLELWQGPGHFRAIYDKGQYGPGHTLDRINQYGIEGATSNGRFAPIYAVSYDPADGAVVIAWLISLSGREPPFQTERFYGDGPGSGFYNRLRDDEECRNRKLAHLPQEQRYRAIGAYACGATIRSWLCREFSQAIDAAHCEIWARIGNKVAPFRRVPADVFNAYKITSWGNGKRGAAKAELEGAPPLYAIHVAASESYLRMVNARQPASRLTYEEAVQWCRDWIANGNGNGMDAAWASFRSLANSAGCARDTFFRPAWTEAKTKLPKG